MYEIIDDNSVIYSGSENEMTHIFSILKDSESYDKEDIEKYSVEWSGDLKLIQVIDIHR